MSYTEIGYEGSAIKHTRYLRSKKAIETTFESEAERLEPTWYSIVEVFSVC